MDNVDKGAAAMPHSPSETIFAHVMVEIKVYMHSSPSVGKHASAS